MEIPGHRIDERLREIPESRTVLRTFARGRNCVTRVLLSDRVDPRLGPEIEKIVMTGEGFAPLPQSLDLTLAGYRVAARLPKDPTMPWTSAVAAGVTPAGWLYVSTRWIDGTPLHHLLGQLSPRLRRQIVQDVARILVELHARSIAYGDFKADNLVMTAGGQMVLIDLDTLRLVPGPTMPAVTRDVTRSWAAPEQFQQKTYLSSDLYAFGRLIGELFPEDLPLEWQELVVACRLADPLKRPQTNLVYQRLRGQKGALRDWCDRPTPPAAPPPDGATERLEEEEFEQVVDVAPVPEAPPPEPRPSSPTIYPVPIHPAPIHSEPVQIAPTYPAPPPPSSPSSETLLLEPSPEAIRVDTSPPVSPPINPPNHQAPPRNKAPQRGLMGCLWLALLPFGLTTAICGGFGFWYYQQNLDEANRLAEQTVAEMKVYKTVQSVNDDKTQRKSLKEKAEKSWATAQTPRSGAVRALATIWEQGWQDTGKNWNNNQYETGMRVVNETPDPTQPEALLALATLQSASCRLRPAATTAFADCDQSNETLDRFFAVIPDRSELYWLRVEATWVRVMVLSQQYFTANKARSAEASVFLARARQVCTEVEPYVDYGPVNGPELLEDCLVLDGKAEDVDGYIATAQRILSRTTSTTILQHLYTSAGPGCENITFRKNNQPSSKTDPWCVAMGWAAQQQWMAAYTASLGHSDDNHPWDRLMSRLQKEIPQAFVTPASYWQAPWPGE